MQIVEHAQDVKKSDLVAMSAALFNSPMLRQRVNCLRLQEMEDDDVQTFGRCDCKSYSYFALSMVLFSVGTVVTVMALGDAADGMIFRHLGHMWLVGPIFICSGLMVAVKSMLYLRRKSIIQMLLHQRAIFRASLLRYVYFKTVLKHLLIHCFVYL